MGEENAVREITKLTGQTIILKETLPNGKEFVVKEKLVQLYPDRLTWVSTHISGPNKYSQFLYEIIAEPASNSRLDFTAHQVEYKTETASTDVIALTDNLCKYDSHVWRLLAKAMEKEIGR